MNSKMALALFVLLSLFSAPASAGLYYSGEHYAELPSRFRGFLVDYRSLRAAAIERPRDVPVSPLRGDFLSASERLEKLAKTRPLTADENADLGALCIRLGKPDKAIGILLQAARKSPEHFHLAANLGTAFQVSGDLERAAEYLEEAVRLAPEKLRPFERSHLKLVRLRIKEGRQANLPIAVDDLFGVKYVGESGNAEAARMADAERKKLPDDAIATIEQLLLWLPADGRLLWQLGELANVHGDVRTAAAILDGCVTEFAMSAPDLRKRRQLYRTAADEQAKKPDHEQHKITFNGKSSRPLLRTFDESSLPAIKADGVNRLPWPVLAATTIGAKGRPTFMKYLEQLDGKTVTLIGFMQPMRDELTLTGFLMLEYPVGCWFCETPEATGLVNVELKEGNSVELRKGLVKVTGKLSLNRTDPETYLFNIKDARVGEVD
ncbi:MAG TPA: tetratricopeptide repeat protein [Gemmata sp.]|jgi:tetratricopeptide (TPR) repeat protein|nr:tetratricopeptide repeat protein [Gemmata sp.]